MTDEVFLKKYKPLTQEQAKAIREGWVEPEHHKDDEGNYHRHPYDDCIDCALCLLLDTIEDHRCV
jgi:hypothetical protein